MVLFRTRVYGMRASARRRGLTLFSLSWNVSSGNSDVSPLCARPRDDWSTTSVNLEVTDTFLQVGQSANTESANNEDQPHIIPSINMPSCVLCSQNYPPLRHLSSPGLVPGPVQNSSNPKTNLTVFQGRLPGRGVLAESSVIVGKILISEAGEKKVF